MPLLSTTGSAGPQGPAPECERNITPGQAALALWLYAYHLFIVSARGLVRLVCGKTGWAKTRRNAETAGVGPVATEA
ncbi:hypothetical protein AMK27_38770 [Streptomyces sp. CB02009]|uniref:hypothetical protein n=1 Tax=Streptomyces sp. CB02009 TaxID=1703938 RepID=UPI0009640C03|nr:hypothetical protein AMK27_38770 [Streptomyces sp. CB02009]